VETTKPGRIGPLMRMLADYVSAVPGYEPSYFAATRTRTGPSRS
jgi:hypothetical protein